MIPGPLVSICIPTWQGEAFVREALQSAAAQCYRPLEIVVSDGGSTDNTLAIVEDFARTSPVPVQLHHFEGQGIGANWNYCIERSGGAYLKLLFQDDVLHPECVAKMMELAISDERIVMVFCRRKLQYDLGDPVHRQWVDRYQHLHLGWKNLRRVTSGKSLLGDRNLLRPPLNKIGEPSCTLFTRPLFEQVGGFCTEMRQSLDIAFYYQALREGLVGFVDEELATFRLHPGQATHQNRTVAVQQKESALLLALILSDEVFPYLNWYVRFRLRLAHSPRLALFGRMLEAVRHTLKR